MTDRSRLPLRLAPLLALLLLGAVVAPATWAQDQDGGADGMGEGTDLRSSYDEVLDEEAALEEAVDLAATRRARLLVDIATVQRELDATRAKLDEATRLLQAAVRKRDVARAALRAAQRRLTRATEQLHAQAVSSYVTGGTDNEMLAVLISSAGDVSATGRTLSYATAVVDHQGEVIDAFNAARRERNRLADRAESAARAATDARDGLAGVAADQEATQTHLMELAAKEDEAARYQELALQQLRGRKIEIEARVVALEKESDSIGILLAAHQAKQKDYKVGSIEFQPPLEDIDLGSGFGMRVHPILRYERLHAGVDLERAERHGDPGRRQGQGGPRRAEGWLRQLRGDLPRVRHRHGVRAPVAPLGAARRQGRGGRRHRRGRLDRPVDRSPPPLRDPGAGCAGRPGELHRPRSRRRSESRRRLTTGPDCASDPSSASTVQNASTRSARPCRLRTTDQGPEPAGVTSTSSSPASGSM